MSTFLWLKRKKIFLGNFQSHHEACKGFLIGNSGEKKKQGLGRKFDCLRKKKLEADSTLNLLEPGKPGGQ